MRAPQVLETVDCCGRGLCMLSVASWTAPRYYAQPLAVTTQSCARARGQALHVNAKVSASPFTHGKCQPACKTCHIQMPFGALPAAGNVGKGTRYYPLACHGQPAGRVKTLGVRYAEPYSTSAFLSSSSLYLSDRRRRIDAVFYRPATTFNTPPSTAMISPLT